MFLRKAYIAIHKFDIICVLEIYLDSNTPSDDNNLEISGYTLVCSDHPSNNKRSGVCIYYKNFLSLRILNAQHLQESICFKLKIGDRTCNFLSLYGSLSQSQDDFETFTENLELNLENLVQKNRFLLVAISETLMLNQATSFVKTKLALNAMKLKINIPVWIALVN